MEKLNTTSLIVLNGVDVELGVTKLRADKFKEGLYIIPIFINETAFLAQTSEDKVQPMMTDAPYELYNEEKHGEGNLEYITPEEFYEKTKNLSPDSTCMYVMRTIHDLLSNKQYERIAEILDQVNLADFEEDGVGVYMMSSSNPISPLMRPIPGEENVADLNAARNRFYTKCVDHYNITKGKKKSKSLMRGHEPKDYNKTVADYDALYMGGAPKES